MIAPSVLVIITAYNSPQALRRCLNALADQTRLPDGVLIVDNSEPVPADISEIAETIRDRARLLRPGRNTGPAGGFSLGLTTFMGEEVWTHAWLMDDDCYPDHLPLRGCWTPQQCQRRPGLSHLHQ